MPIDAQAKVWPGYMETYRLIQDNDRPILEVKMDTIEKYVDYFKSTFT